MRTRKASRKKSLSRSKIKPPENRPSTVILEKVKETGKTAKHLKGYSLNTKFAIAISTLSVFICAFSGFIVYFKTKTSLIEEINRKGAALVKAVENIALEYASEVQKHPEEEEATRARFEKYLENMSLANDGSQSSEIFGILLKSNSSDIRSLADYGISGGSNETYYEKRGDNLYETNITIVKSYMTKPDKKTYPTRSYKKDVLNGKMTVYVTLSEYEINNTAQTIFVSILFASVLAIVVGIAISFFLTSRITNPIRKLMKDIEIVARGKLEHRTHATSKDEIGVLAHTFNVMTQNLRMAHNTELENQAREHELQIANEIQSNLLPKTIPDIPGYDIGAFYHPSKEVGGDYYDFIDIDEKHLAITIADVSGKGVPGSMVMTMTRSLIRMQAKRSLSPSDVLTEVNRVIAQDIKRGMFVTAMYCILNKETGELKLSSAGHNPAILIKSNGAYELLNTKGLALGLDKGKIFARQTQTITTRLNRGDRLVLFTDGIPEAMSPRNEEFGDDKFYQLVSKSCNLESKKFVSNIVNSIAKWRRNAPQSDDITIVTLKH
ncbi:PP2C family protein-serine/threonine phosphatase [Candidatus Uabimicrobium sp. HlEnr_7]|uniref:PP2C family protein-serine/threonine phosphatase n=1 Tax=Candidatus Uabimicrobium helgolandensis TaxID=3095367 RepID=UPI0035592EF6